jgi:hypothetical protein
MRERVKEVARADTFRVIDPTCGRIHSHSVDEKDAKRDAIVIAGCRGASVIIRNGELPEDVTPRILALLEVATAEASPCRSEC